MDAYTASEISYNNGYEKGYKDGFADGSKDGNGQRIGFWKWTKDGNRVCSHCGTLEPDSLPGACAIYSSEKRYCFFCGTRLIYPKGQ